MQRWDLDPDHLPARLLLLLMALVILGLFGFLLRSW
jgi:hypothetical protein